MTEYCVTAIPEEISNQVRASLVSPQYGHPAHVELATGYGPCRSCLKTFHQEEERRILFTYNRFAGLDALPAPGPIFIHEKNCERYKGSTFPEELRSLPLFLEAYGPEGVILERERIVDQQIEGVIDRFFRNAAVKYIHIRNFEAGCFIAHIGLANNHG